MAQLIVIKKFSLFFLFAGLIWSCQHSSSQTRYNQNKSAANKSANVAAGEKKMPNDPFFTTITEQLITAPEKSKQVLAANPTAMPAVPKSAEFPVESAKSWVSEVLKEEYQPPADAVFVPLPRENNLCDVVRSTFQSDVYKFETAQSKYLLSIKVKSGTPSTTDARTKAENLARRLFKLGDKVHLETLGNYGGGVYGRQNTEVAGREDADFPFWLDSLRWWSEKDEIGFVLLKAAGGPTKEVISVSTEQNTVWFK